MKKGILVLMIGLLLITTNLIAEAGDLIVNGKVGIGTTSPQVPLHIVSGSPGVTIQDNAHDMTDTNAAAYIVFRDKNGTTMGYVGDGGGGKNITLDAETGYNLIFGAGGFPRMYIDSSTGYVGIGTLNPAYTLHVNGAFAATSKNFDIPDPRFNDPKKRLIHSTLEGPEISVFYRGESQLVNGKVIIKLPEYFEALTRKEGRTVLLTPKFERDDESISNLAAATVIDGKFAVKAIDKSNLNQKFYWKVKAVRADVKPLEVEANRDK